jgi:Uma2 family endonuclease
MAPIGSPHAAIVIRLNSRFGALAADRYLISPQNPLQIPPYSEPQPDIVLLRPRADGYYGSLPQPSDVLLLVEVADSSLEWDRDVKIPIYGRQGVIESWLVDLQHRTVTVFRDPPQDGYRSSVEIREGAVSPSCLTDIAIALDDLFG